MPSFCYFRARSVPVLFSNFFLRGRLRKRKEGDSVASLPLSVVVEVAHALHDLDAVAGACVRLFYFYGIQDVTTLR